MKPRRKKELNLLRSKAVKDPGSSEIRRRGGVLARMQKRAHAKTVAHGC